MRFLCAYLLLGLLAIPAPTQENADGPSNAKAQKTYKEALEFLKRHEKALALDSFKKADKQDGGHCLACQKKIVNYGPGAAGRRDGKAQGRIFHPQP